MRVLHIRVPGREFFVERWIDVLHGLTLFVSVLANRCNFLHMGMRGRDQARESNQRRCQENTYRE